MWACGAPRSASGESTITKLIPSVCQSTARRLAIVAVMLRPSTLMTTGSPILRPSPSAVLASNETKGGPRQILGLDPAGADDAPAQHRHPLEPGVRRPRVHEGVEASRFGVLDVDEIERWRAIGQ